MVVNRLGIPVSGSLGVAQDGAGSGTAAGAARRAPLIDFMYSISCDDVLFVSLPLNEGMIFWNPATTLAPRIQDRLTNISFITTHCRPL